MNAPLKTLDTSEPRAEVQANGKAVYERVMQPPRLLPYRAEPVHAEVALISCG